MKRPHHFSSILISTLFGLSISGFAVEVPQELIETLGNEDFQQREDAEKKLSNWTKGKGKETFNKLEQLKEKSKSPEVRMRLNNVLDGMTIFEPIPNTRGYIGISMNPILGGVTINRVQPNTPAAKHGLMVGDVITGLDGVDLTEKKLHHDEAMIFLRDYVKKKNAGDKLTLKLLRNGDALTKELKLADYDKAELNGMPLRQLQGNNNLQVFPRPGGGGNLQLRIQPNLDAEGLQMQLQAQELMDKMLEMQLKRQPNLNLKPEDLKQDLKELMLQQRKEMLEFQKKQLEELKKP